MKINLFCIVSRRYLQEGKWVLEWGSIRRETFERHVVFYFLKIHVDMYITYRAKAIVFYSNHLYAHELVLDVFENTR